MKGVKVDIKNVIEERNNSWKNNLEIPKWVKLEDVSLDQFFTKKEIAKQYYEKMLYFLKKEKIIRR